MSESNQTGAPQCARFDDFDLQDPSFRRDPGPLWRQMRENCPVAHTSLHGGGWMLSRYADITEVALDPGTFSSRAGEVTGPIPAEGRELKLPPVNTDPPDHAAQRKLLMPFFSKQAVEELEPVARSAARHLVTRILGMDGDVDAVEHFARTVPVVVTTHMLGLPTEDQEQFRRWTLQMLADGAEDYQARGEAVSAIRRYFADRLATSVVEGAPGIIPFLRARQAVDPSLTDETALGMAFLMLIAGIDTTWSALGASLWHLAHHPGDRRLLAESPELIPAAVEELLRVYAPVTIGRVVTRDVEIGGRLLRAGDRVVLPWAAANRDPERHDHPDNVVLGPDRVRHLAFGVGIHRCLGAGLAQMELRVALEEWLARIPEFEPTAGEVPWSAGNTRGPETLPLRIPGAAVGGR
ncbi:cytochrome P450 [Nocardioides endophyticus]|uniref:Cytochrome P450 n=1 Tax=Nocardioides endophyticus TaxID=1353775 RepID=A0ABP8YI03_9ACTN